MRQTSGLWLVILVASSLCAATASAEDLREAIETQNQALIAAILSGGAEAVADLYTVDAVVVPPGALIATGRKEIVAFWCGAIEAGIQNLSLEIGSVESDGDLAYEVGVVKLVAGDGQLNVDRYVVVWKREMGIWKLHRDIWNSAGK